MQKHGVWVYRFVINTFTDYDLAVGILPKTQQAFCHFFHGFKNLLQGIYDSYDFHVTGKILHWTGDIGDKMIPKRRDQYLTLDLRIEIGSKYITLMYYCHNNKYEHKITKIMKYKQGIKISVELFSPRIAIQCFDLPTDMYKITDNNFVLEPLFFTMKSADK